MNPTITLNDGREMPRFGLGTFRMSPAEAERLTARAIALGYRAIDTARVYDNEEGVGAGVRGSDATIFVTSKLWRSDYGAVDAVARGFEGTMARLGLEWLDLYLMHWPFVDEARYVETWAALVELQKRDGRLRSIGVSNFEPHHLERIIAATGVAPAVNQVELHPTFQQRALRDFHARHGIATTSWAPLGRDGGLDHAPIRAAAERTGKTPAQVVIRWHLQHDLVVIPKTATPGRLAENLDVSGFELGAEEMAAIDALDRADGRTGPDPEGFEGF